jgi:hypothetical protein
VSTEDFPVTLTEQERGRNTARELLEEAAQRLGVPLTVKRRGSSKEHRRGIQSLREAVSAAATHARRVDDREDAEFKIPVKKIVTPKRKVQRRQTKNPDLRFDPHQFYLSPALRDAKEFSRPVSKRNFDDEFGSVSRTARLDFNDAKTLHVIQPKPRRPNGGVRWSDQELLAVVQRTFPNIFRPGSIPINERGNFFNAARWLEVGRLYLVRDDTAENVAESLGLTVGSVRSTVKSIRNARDGLTRHGKVPKGTRTESIVQETKNTDAGAGSPFTKRTEEFLHGPETVEHSATAVGGSVLPHPLADHLAPLGEGTK